MTMDGKRIILIIEDEPDISKTLKVFLESEGFDVSIASDGIEGLNKVKAERPNLIVLDIMLPKLDGFQICRMLKFDDKYKKIPIIMLTARAQESDRRLGKEVGADAYLAKPFEPEVLLNKIKEFLR